MPSSQSPRSYSFRQPSVVGTDVEVTLKWFDPARGFGFVKPNDGSGDALLPGAIVQSAGLQAIPEGSSMVVDLVEGRKGAQVSAIHSVDTSTARPSAPRGDRAHGERPGGRAPGGARSFGERSFGERSFGGGPRRSFGGGGAGGAGGGGGGGGGGGPTTEIEGTVKWFNPQKGFGFITPDSGGRDVFVHVRAVERSGMTGLAEQQRVRVTVRQGEKGPEAVDLSAA